MSPSVTYYDILPGIPNICALRGGWGGWGWRICFDNFVCYITAGEKRLTQYSNYTMGQMIGD